MRFTVDLPEPLLHEAASVAAKRGLQLSDLVAEAMIEKLQATGHIQTPARTRVSEWDAF